MSTDEIDYRSAGVDVEAGQRLVRNIAGTVAATHSPNVLAGIGGFAGLYALAEYRDPVLVSGTDGVGTKLELARAARRFDTIGIDLVGMCVNDIVCHGADPLFFLDYIALDSLEYVDAQAIVAGVAEGCARARCSLIGGETAEMPGVYREGRFDLAGFAVGAVERHAIIDGSALKAGMVVVGLGSSGFHSNGYSLLRRLFPEVEREDAGAEAVALRDALLTPTRIYAAVLADLRSCCTPAGIAHVTGGGWWENMPRLLGVKRDSLALALDASAVAPPEVFSCLVDTPVTPAEAFRTFNMGIGMAVALDEGDVNTAMEVAASHGIDAVVIGSVVDDDGATYRDGVAIDGIPGDWSQMDLSR